MALINHAKREINAKIVYYGCEGAGKSTSLKYVYDRIKPSLRGEMKSLPTSGGSLLFFDFSPFEALVFGGYRVRFHIYTLPGKVVNPAAWKMTLKGADGLVVVADVNPERMSASRNSIVSLRDFLAAYGLGLHDIPTVLQHNPFKRNGKISPDEAAAALDLAGIPACHAEAVSGEGVLETLTMLSRAIMKRIGQDDSLKVGEAGTTPLDDPSPEEAAGTDSGEEHSGPVGGEEDLSAELPARACETEDVNQAIDSRQIEESFHVGLAGDCAMCLDGIVRIPLELTVGGESRRLVVSIAIEQA